MTQDIYKETITVRKRLDFGFESDDIPKYWLDGNPYKTRLIDAVQATFPDGERYFISSVAAFNDKITDPELATEVKDFMQQEGQHGKVHTDYNNRLARQGLKITAFTNHTIKLTKFRLKHYSASYNVALTAALEHFTAMMADLFFAEKSVLAGGDKRVRAMLAWHAIEEMEHKAVAYDVMQKVAKVGYFKRCIAMTHAIATFSLFTMIAPWFMLKMDGLNFRQRCAAYIKNLPWMIGPRKGIMTRLLPMLARYYKPGFHPNHLKSVHNYDVWVNNYASTGNPITASQAMYAAAR